MNRRTTSEALSAVPVRAACRECHAAETLDPCAVDYRTGMGEPLPDE